MRYQALLFFAFATLLASGPAPAQTSCYPSSACDHYFPSQPNWLYKPSWQGRQEIMQQQNEQNEARKSEGENRRLRALRAQEQNERWRDSSFRLHIPNRKW
ncbi:MAG: hypothetical protein OEM93_19045 [Rhodospirillales bacterium]|nr:hypothetical protein [Rhodospirillales bacterium]MDH3917331.1 hypothetical protein [Rhodospirillales bacterium]